LAEVAVSNAGGAVGFPFLPVDTTVVSQLHLAVRGGTGLERFYARLGWREIGRWPGALRLAPGDDRDEILMVLSPL
jgi:catechol-2,3-dioxygenase